MTICPHCNQYLADFTIGDFTSHHCPTRAVTTPPVVIYRHYPVKDDCDHCYCKRSVELSHKKCCNCGNEQLGKLELPER